jgi:hypothetical protein
MNAKEATHIRTTLEALGYSQGATFCNIDPDKVSKLPGEEVESHGDAVFLAEGQSGTRAIQRHVAQQRGIFVPENTKRIG